MLNWPTDYRKSAEYLDTCQLVGQLLLLPQFDVSMDYTVPQDSALMMNIS